MEFRIISKNNNIPKDFIIGTKSLKVDCFKDMTVIQLDNNCAVYIHHDTGEVDLIEFYKSE